MSSSIRDKCTNSVSSSGDGGDCPPMAALAAPAAQGSGCRLVGSAGESNGRPDLWTTPSFSFSLAALLTILLTPEIFLLNLTLCEL